MPSNTTSIGRKAAEEAKLNIEVDILGMENSDIVIVVVCGSSTVVVH